MAKPGKKAELDADGIALPQKNKEPDPKVELDKEGLNIKNDGKAELDKEGMSFLKKIQNSISKATHTEKPAQESSAGGAQPQPAARPWLIPAIAGLCVVLVLGSGLGGYFWFKAKTARNAKALASKAATQQVKPAVLVNEGEILLDPFMVMYETRSPSKAGILVAQLSLQVNPKTAANVRSKLFEIRTIIHENLIKNALIYTQFELIEMLKEHLRPFDIADIAFVKFDLR